MTDLSFPLSRGEFVLQIFQNSECLVTSSEEAANPFNERPLPTLTGAFGNGSATRQGCGKSSSRRTHLTLLRSIAEFAAEKMRVVERLTPQCFRRCRRPIHGP